MTKKITCPTQLIHPDAKAPFRSSEKAAGHDICCVAGLAGIDTKNWPIDQITAWELMERQGRVTVEPGGSFLFRTGFAQAIEPGHACYFWDRSGMGGTKLMHRMAGVIDEDYRGEWFVRLVNHSTRPVAVLVGDKIVQGIYSERIEADCPIVDQLDDTARGTGGFGSTDVNPEPVDEEDAPSPAETDVDGGSSMALTEEEEIAADVAEAAPGATGADRVGEREEIIYNGANVGNVLACLRDKQYDSAAAWISRDTEFFPNGVPQIDEATIRVIPGAPASAAFCTKE